jgi:hypothetical protein
MQVSREKALNAFNRILSVSYSIKELDIKRYIYDIALFINVLIFASIIFS